MDRDRLDDDHPGAAERPLPVVADVPIAGQPGLGHVRRVRPERDPAGQGLVAQRDGLEHVREGHRSCSMARWPTPHRSSWSRVRRRPARPSSGSGWRRRSSPKAGPRRSSRPIPGRCIAASISARPRWVPRTGRAFRTRAWTSSIRRSGSPWRTSWRTPAGCWPRWPRSDGVALLVGRHRAVPARRGARHRPRGAAGRPGTAATARGGARRRRPRRPSSTGLTAARTHAGCPDRHGQSRAASSARSRSPSSAATGRDRPRAATTARSPGSG